MSWNGYIDNLLGHCSNNADKACIIGQDGSLWTTGDHANNLNLSPQEAKTIATSCKTGDYSGFQASGVYIGGIKYQFLRNQENIVLAKKKDQGAITIQLSKTAIVIGHTKEGSSQGETNKGVAVIAEYLESLNM